MAPLFNRLSAPWKWRVIGLGAPRFFVGVVAICVDEGRVLLARHRVGDPRWRLPGGFLQRNETIEECIRRELREELGRAAEGIDLVRVSAGYRYPRVEIVVRCRLIGAPGPFSSEVIEARYFSLEELPELRADQRRMIERALSGSAQPAEPAERGAR